MNLTSTAFLHYGPIPVDHTGDGRDLSPILNWIHVPPHTKEFALICDDPDAPTPEPWVHWILYKIPADWRELPEGVGNHTESKLPGHMLQGCNSWTAGNTIGYRGPLPPPGHGVHHYHFRLYALNHSVDLQAGVTKAELLKSIEGHVLEVAELIGTYQR